MATRNSKKRRTKRGMAITMLGAFSLALVSLFVVFYATDSFAMYWFLLSNQDSTLERRRQADVEWYSGSSSSSTYTEPGSSESDNPTGATSRPLYSNTSTTPLYTLSGNNLSLDVLMEQFELSEIASGEFMARFLIFKMDQAGYVPNAVIGAVAYSLCEAGGMGTFTYENYYFKEYGPQGTFSKTLDNQAWLDWMNGPGKARAKSIYDNNYDYENGHYCIGMGGFQQTIYWYSDGSVSYDHVTPLIEAATEAGVYWQDPDWQTDRCLSDLDSDVSWDLDQNGGVDPKSSSNITADEWCARVTAGVGMPNWKYTRVLNGTDWYATAHMEQVAAAEALYSKYSGVDDLFYNKIEGVNPGGSVGGVLTSYTDPFSGPSYDNTTPQGLAIARMAVMLSYDTRIAYNGAKPTGTIATGFQKFTDSNLANTTALQYWRYAQNSMEGDFWASCDRFASGCVLLAGIDPNIPRGPTTDLADYLAEHSTIWKDLGDGSSAPLQAGDILIKSGSHAVVYIGETVAGERWPGTTINVAQASYFEYYPYASHNDQSRFAGYIAYRCINPTWASTRWDSFISSIGDKFPELPRTYAKTSVVEAKPDSITESTELPTNTAGLTMDGDWAWPLKDSFNITSPWNPSRTLTLKGVTTTKPHRGHDISAPEGTEIYAPLDGVVIVAQGWDENGWGYYCKIDHGNGYATLYAHQCKPPPLTDGQEVKQGDVIGYVGNTGRSGGNHLHYEIYHDDDGDGSFTRGEQFDGLAMYPNLQVTINSKYKDTYKRP